MPLPPIRPPWPLRTEAEQRVLDAAAKDAEWRRDAPQDQKPPHTEIVTDPKRRPLR